MPCPTKLYPHALELPILGAVLYQGCQPNDFPLNLGVNYYVWVWLKIDPGVNNTSHHT